jgi:hypothetical protein
MKMLVTEEQVNLIFEFFKKENPFASFIRQQLEKVYRPLGMWSRASNPDGNCETGLGVVGVFPHSEYDQWSVLNRFDTNILVKNEMNKIFLDANPDVKKRHESDFMRWIEENRNDLFGPKGKYTKKLIALNKETIKSGNKREEFAVEVLKNRFKTSKVSRFCAGDIRDTRKGMDISIRIKGVDITVQVKKFDKVASYVEDDGDTFFEVTSDLQANKYSEKNVDIFMFVSPDSQEYILFANKKTKIGQMRNNIVRFYEPFLMKSENINFTHKQKRKMKNFDPTYNLFGMEKNKLDNLYFRKSEIEKQISKMEKQMGKK